MSAEQHLTEEDRALLDHIDGQIDAAEDVDDFEQLARDLRDAFADHRAEFRAFKRQVEYRFDELEAASTDGGGNDDAPPIVHYANIPEEERSDLLSTSEQIAVALHTHWDDVAWALGGGGTAASATVTSDGRLDTADGRSSRRVGVDTKTKAAAKHNPSKLRHELKLLLDRDFQATELYRGLKRLAKLSGGEERVNETDGRVHISGGLYEYREQATTDKQAVRRVLWRADDV